MGYKLNPFTGNLDATDSPNGVFEAVEVNGDITLDDGGTYATTLQLITPTANRTISFPDATGTVGLVGGSSGQLVYNNAGAYAGDGNLTWDATAGLTLGRKVLVNEQSGFSGNLLDLQVAGSSKLGFIGNTHLRLGSGTGGIQFNGDSAAANALDDYEEGTWTPVITTDAFGATSDITTTGTYTKTGNVVTCYVTINFGASSTIGAGNPFRMSLPFTATAGGSMAISQTTTLGVLTAGYISGTMRAARASDGGGALSYRGSFSYI